MNAIDFYGIVRRLFGTENVVIGGFVNPLLNRHEAFIDVQFVDSNGNPVIPWHRTATTFLLPDPLTGPFYSLPLTGWWSKKHHGYDGKFNYAITVAVILPNGEEAGSYPILIKNSDDNVISSLKEACGVLPYLNEKNTIITDPVNELVQEIREIKSI
jgi:hypothetical protein